MTEPAPRATPTLASQVSPSAEHRARAWPEFFGQREITCGACKWSARGADLGELVAAAVNHAPRVVVRDHHGEVLAVGEDEQREARRTWDAGSPRTVSEAVRQRLNGGDMDQDGMSQAIRRRAATGSGISQSVGRRLREAMEAPEPNHAAEEQAAAARALEAGRARNRRARGLSPAPEEEPESRDPSDVIRGAVSARRSATARAFEERLFGSQDEAGGDAGEGGDAA